MKFKDLLIYLIEYKGECANIGIDCSVCPISKPGLYCGLHTSKIYEKAIQIFKDNYSEKELFEILL